MSFLAPLFLLGALAIALPVIFHLIRRTTRERTPFSSLMFLLPTPPRLTRRSRLEHILLLLLRAAVLGFLAFGFARPFLKRAIANDPSSAAAVRMVLLVDTSASMRRADLWPNARDKVASLLRRISPADQVAVFTFDRQVNPLVTFDQWNAAPVGERAALATRRLAEISPGWSATHLGNALISAAEALADPDANPATGPRRIVLVTDLQEGSRFDQLQGYEWPRGLELSAEILKAKHPGNAGLQLVADSDEANRKASPSVRVRVTNTADAQREQFQVGWARPDGRSFVGPPVAVYVPPGQSRIVPVPLPAAEATVDRLILQGDAEDFDNTVFVIPPETARVSVLYLGNDSDKDPRQPLFFLQRAFQETPRQAVQVLPRPAGALLAAPEAPAASLVVVADPLSPELARALHDQVAAGKTLLFVIRNAAASATLAWLLGLDGLTLEEARVAGYAMLADIDFRHPLLAPFADPRFSDFTSIHFWQYRRLDASAIPGARLVAKFDTGDPALVEVPLGKGRVFVLTSGWHPADSQLALSTKFVPLLYSLLELSDGAPAAPTGFLVGDPVPLPAETALANVPVTVQAPDGKTLTLAAGETNYTQTLVPGIYRVNFARTSKRFAVNLDAAESRTAPLSVEALERLGAPVSHHVPDATAAAERKVRLQNAELEGRQKLWRWVIVATLAVLLIETWLAGRTARRLALQGEATT